MIRKGLCEFAKGLVELGFEDYLNWMGHIKSYKMLALVWLEVDKITKFPECLKVE